MKNKVFVYGTLRRGGKYHHFLEDATFLGEGVVKGKLFDSGKGYPFMTKGEERVVGEVYEVSEETFEKLDELEEYPELYDRDEMEVEMKSDEEISAWVYHRSEEGEEPIPSGDWLEYNTRNISIISIIFIILIFLLEKYLYDFNGKIFI